MTIKSIKCTDNWVQPSVIWAEPTTSTGGSGNNNVKSKETFGTHLSIINLHLTLHLVDVGPNIVASSESHESRSRKRKMITESFAGTTVQKFGWILFHLILLRGKTNGARREGGGMVHISFHLRVRSCRAILLHFTVSVALVVYS